jgi:outer membrane protein assembly factor BamE (lipoprotein component of BamABCDE complex)
MGRSMAMLMLISLMLTQTACSVYWALKQPPQKDLEGLGVGATRQQLLARLGPPQFSETDTQGRKQDLFEFQSGMHQATKVRALLYAGADFFTLGLAELILWPMELTVMKDATCNAVVTYDASQVVDSWKVDKAKKGGELQGC